MTVATMKQGQKGLPPTSTQERYGIAYLSTVCAEAGVGIMETRPGEDHYGIDAYLNLSRGMVSVQVKCTTKQFTSKPPQHITWGITQKWWDKWCSNSAPVFILLVQVPNDGSDWIDHAEEDLTTHYTAGYWVEIDKTLDPRPNSVLLPRAHRFTRDTLVEWDLIHRKGLGLP